MIKFCHIITLAAVLSMTGCAATTQTAAMVGGSAAGATGLGLLGSALSHVGASVVYDGTTGNVTGNLYFKNGRLMVQPAADTRALAVDRGCVEPTRAIVDPRGCVPETRSIETPLAVQAIDFRAIVQAGAVRDIGVSSRSIARGVSRAAKDAKEDEDDRHNAENRRLDKIIRATSQTTYGRMRRAVTGASCDVTALPGVSVSTETASSPPPIFAPAPAQLPDPANDNTAALTPNGIMKGVSNLESRVTALETNQKSDHDRLLSMDGKLDLLLKAAKP